MTAGKELEPLRSGQLHHNGLVSVLVGTLVDDGGAGERGFHNGDETRLHGEGQSTSGFRHPANGPHGVVILGQNGRAMLYDTACSVLYFAGKLPASFPISSNFLYVHSTSV